MKTVSIAILVVGILTSFAGPVAAQPRATFPIALISVQRIGNESMYAKEAAKRLETLRQAKAQEINAKQKELEGVRLQLANAGGIFRASRRSELAAEEKRQETDLQRLTQQAQTDLQKLQRDIETDIRRRVGEIVTDIAKRRGIQFVLNQDTAVILAPTGIDLTTEVIERLNMAPAQKPPAK
jgi:outer membrane protein